MYNSIPIELALSCTRSFLLKNNLTALEMAEILNLLSLCITSNTFYYEGKKNLDTKRSSMGSHLSPILVTMIMDHLESSLLSVAQYQF